MDRPGPFCGGKRGRGDYRSDPGICGGFPPQIPIPRSYRRCGGRSARHTPNARKVIHTLVYSWMVRGFLGKLGLALSIMGGAVCAVLHLATFVTIVPFVWILIPFAFLFGSVLCAQAFKTRLRYQRRTGKWTRLGLVILAYAVLMFIYVYRTTGGASSVSIVDGKYVAMYKDQIIRTITESEYRMFPNLWMRVMSAWIGMMAVFSLTQFLSTDGPGTQQDDEFNAGAGWAVKWGMPPRDWRTIYLHEVAIYEVVVPLFFLNTGVPPFWFFVLQGVGHWASAAISNKFFWWYGRRAEPRPSRLLLAAAGCGWIIAAYLFGT